MVSITRLVVLALSFAACSAVAAWLLTARISMASSGAVSTVPTPLTVIVLCAGFPVPLTIIVGRIIAKRLTMTRARMASAVM